MRHRERNALVTAALLVLLVLVALLALDRCATVNSLSEGSAGRAVGDLSPAVVDGAPGGEWLRVEPDGSLSATGFIDVSEEDWRIAFARGTFLGLLVKQEVGRLTVFHLVPLLVDRRTALVDDGRSVTWEEVRGRRPTSRPVSARFSVRGLFIHADRLEWAEKPVPARWPYDHIPSAMPSIRQVLSDRARPVKRSPWLEVSLESSMLDRTWPLEGRAGQAISAETPIDGMASSVDVAVLDKLGPVAIYHVVTVFVPERTGAEAAAAAKKREWVRADVTVEGERLIAVSLR